jgi:hypothetical protein
VIAIVRLLVRDNNRTRLGQRKKAIGMAKVRRDAAGTRAIGSSVLNEWHRSKAQKGEVGHKKNQIIFYPRMELRPGERKLRI